MTALAPLGLPSIPPRYSLGVGCELPRTPPERLTLRYILEIENVGGGGSTNPSQTTFHVLAPLVNGDRIVASQLIAFAQYMLPAADCQVSRILVGDDAPGPTLPVDFPDTEYAALVAEDTNLQAMTGYGESYGDNALTALGVGAVMSKRSATPGRSGRGRLTTPWLPVTWVDAGGQLATGGPAIIVDGWNAYLRGDTTVVPGTPAVDLDPYIYTTLGAAHPIVAVTVSSDLGRVRSRKR